MSTLKQLYTYIAVAETLHMSAAAKRLFISQPTVSLTISDLEREYDKVFFDRTGRRMLLTADGKTFLKQAYSVIDSYERLENIFKEEEQVRELRIGATITVGNTLMPRIASYLIKEKPDIQPYIVVDNTRSLENKLLDGELDIALIEGTIHSDHIYKLPLVEDYLKIICSAKHPFHSRKTLTPDELQGQKFVLREQGSGTRRLFEGYMQTAKIPLHTIAESTSCTAIIEMVAENLGISAISERCVERYTNIDLIHACTVEGMPMKRQFYICYHSSNPLNSQMEDLIHAAQYIVSEDEK